MSSAQFCYLIFNIFFFQYIIFFLCVFRLFFSFLIQYFFFRQLCHFSLLLSICYFVLSSRIDTNCNPDTSSFPFFPFHIACQRHIEVLTSEYHSAWTHDGYAWQSRRDSTGNMDVSIDKLTHVS